MAYSPFPATYPQAGAYYPQYQQFQQQPMSQPNIFQSGNAQIGQMQNAPAAQTMQTPQLMTPTIHADIVQVANEREAENYPVGVGSSQMMIAKDDSFIAIKTVYANNQYNIDVFDKRQPKEKRADFNPEEYVRRDEIEELIHAAVQAEFPNQNFTPRQQRESAPDRERTFQPQQVQRRATKKEEDK